MAKMKDAPKEAPKADKPDGSEDKPFPWADPFPVSELDKEGEETIFVRAKVKQDLIVNGVKRAAGLHIVVGADFAHGHGNALTAPDPVLPPVQEEEGEDEE